jgi:parallel beta-helix repeat protein
MRVSRKKPNSIPLLLAAAALAIGSYVLAGELEPPGPPEPTMKTLTDVEPRIPIYAGDLPLTISQPGSYYLAENITTEGDGIDVTVGNVTIDLMGHTLSGGTGTGISVDPPANLATGIHIKNGVVRDWELMGLYVSSSESVVSGVTALGNGSTGIYVYGSGLVVDCIASDNRGEGIDVYEGIVHRCEVSRNGKNGIASRSCTRISGCNVHGNELNGIRVDFQAHVVGNQCHWNGAPGNEKAGIFVHSVGSDCRIENNNLTGNDGYGLRIDGSDNTVFRNSANHNGIQDYFIAAGNDVGPIGTAATATSPWANISY